MAEFSELIKKFDKIRDYMRDFYIYGFKSRNDFTKKSCRTYDNERRRIESYMGKYMKWDYSNGSKAAIISVDCSAIPVNPLYSAWKSKSFTSNDIMLHFYILDVLKNKSTSLDILTDEICQKSEMNFDIQTVRNKCNEYVACGLLNVTKEKKTFLYSANKDSFPVSVELLDAVKFFQGVLPFGEVGSYIMDNMNIENDLFSFKHYYIAHTLDNNILFEILSAIRQDRTVIFENQSEKSGKTTLITALPLKVFVSTVTGRRFVCMYSLRTKRFSNYRLDYIKLVVPDTVIDFATELREKLDNNLDKVYGVGFGGREYRSEIICIKLFIDEVHEQYIIERLEREGKGGEILHIGENTFLYTKEVFDSSDMSPWLKTFIGRIISVEGTNRVVINRFYSDIERMNSMYGIGGE